ncbi:autotransporter outer membrane beta-barrel domain-containing protein [Verticiella alkaliphila]|uniref:autotransporter outer membrane beta-barrel domain-containing protein n=1 Tax=Verticiella alkaliphila TaxID=2779529 RepID=UPI00353038E9
MGGFGGAAGDGGAVNVTLGNGSTVQTHGAGSVGILAQSIGGGGGYSGSWDAAVLAGSSERPAYVFENAMSGSSGNGGAVTVAMRPGATASIRTRGERAHGIVAQSLGGGGGLAADAHGLLLPVAESGGTSRTQAKGQGGAITITTQGSIVADGVDAHGIFAQSGVQTTSGALDGTREGRDITIRHTGELKGGSGTGAAVVVEGGANNHVTFEAGSVVSALSGTAVRGSFARETIDNAGTLTGRLDLVGASGEDINTVNNLSGGRLNLTGARLGRQGWLNNAGTLAIGESGQIANVRLEGSLWHQQDATLLVDISPDAGVGQPTSDRLTVTGDTRFQGHVQPALITALLPGRYTFLESTGALDAQGADAIRTWPRHVPIAWSIEQRERALTLVPTAHFATPEGVTLTENQRATAEHLQQAWDQGAAAQASTFAAFVQTPSAEAYADSLDSMSPENTQATAVARLQASRAALKSVMSCPAFVGSGTAWREGDCVWGQANVSRTNQQETNAIQGYRQDAAVYRVGVQREVRPDWFVGVSAAYTDSRLDGLDGLSRSRGDSADVAVALKRQYGNWLFAGSLAVGQGWFDNRRTIQLGDQTRQALSDTRVSTLGTRLRAAYQFAGPRAYVRPQLDLDIIHTRKPGYTESGAGSLDLEVSGLSDTTVALRPNVEFGARLDLASGGWLRPYGSLGVTVLSDDTLSGQANLRGLDGVVADFRTTSHMTRVLGDAGVGVHLMTINGYEVTAEYQAQFGRHFVSHQGSARFAKRF